jgi:hypothetical protein
MGPIPSPGCLGDAGRANRLAEADLPPSTTRKWVGRPMLQLLMTDPDGDTWDLDPVIEMKRALRRKATELDLPFASFTMIAEREPSAKIFA